MGVSGNHPGRLLVVLNLVANFYTSFVSTIATMLLVAPVAVSLYHHVRIAPVPALVTRVLLSGVNNSNAVINSPPGIVVNSTARLMFGSFTVGANPVTLLGITTYVVCLRVVCNGRLPGARVATRRLKGVDVSSIVASCSVLGGSIAVLTLAVFNFVIRGLVNVRSTAVTLANNILTVLTYDISPRRVFHSIS